MTDRCNFRCPYCMPAEIYGDSYSFLPRPELLTFEEIERLAEIFVALGARKVRITGGEPLLRHGLPNLIEQLARIEGIEDLTLTTNAYLLADQARALKEAGLQRVTVSLDSLDEQIFQHMTGGRFELQRVLAGIDAAERAGLLPIKINCVVQRGVNDEGIVDLARHFKGSGHTIRFIEYMDVGTLNGWELSHVVPAREILERIESEFAVEPVDSDYRGEVAQRYRYTDGSGEVGIIASVTRPFCNDCTRVRLSTEGRMITCLFAETGTDLKTPLRTGASDEELAELICQTWGRREDRYSEERTEHTTGADITSPRPKIEMYQIGG